MFAILTASQLLGPIFWIGGKDDLGTLTPTGVQDFLDPARLILAIGVSRQEILWATEQTMRMPGATCVIAEVGTGPDLRESRRLQIAAEQCGCLGIILISGRPQNSAAQTRWHCAANNGEAKWVWRQTKNKSGPVGTWMVNWLSTGERKNDATGLVHMVSCVAA